MNFVLHGYPVSGGITIGYAHLVSTARLEVAHYEVAEQAVDAEVARFDSAIREARAELDALKAHIPAGAPAEFEGHREGTPEPARGHARTIDYDITSGNVSLTGEAWLSDGCKEFRNEQMVYNIKTQSMEAQAVAPTAATGSDGRIHITIQPQTPGKPCAAPGKKTP